MEAGQIFQSALVKRQEIATRLFVSAVEQERIAHAYLLLGGDDRDKESLSLQLAMYLNCQRRVEHGPCHVHIEDVEARCQSCRWIFERKHPQVWFEVSNTESASGKVSVEMARRLAGELAKSSSHKRVVFVPNASQDILHRPAANALLKTIEEPRGDCYFLLLARSKEQVLTTIVSRCQVVPFKADTEAVAGPLYRLASSRGGAPLVGLDLGNGAGGMSDDLVSSLKALSRLEFFASTPGLLREEKKRGGVSSPAIDTGQALELSGRLQELLSSGVDSDRLIDSAVLTELEIIGSKVPDDPRLSYYVHSLLKMAEDAKEQLNRYVTKKAALDCFALDWSQCRRETFG